MAALLRACACAIAMATVAAIPSQAAVVNGTNGPWDHIGPWNFFVGTDPTISSGMGEAGTLANAASPAANPLLIYAGGHNNGASPGIIRTQDGGIHWTRQSKGLWNTFIYGVWLHPDDPKGLHVFAGTGAGIYESTDGAESWQIVPETATLGIVLSFREGVIGGKPYIVANCGKAYILTRLMSGGKWNTIKAPNGMYANQELSIVTTAGKSEVFTCVAGGKLYYGALDTPTNMTWEGPLMVNGSATESINCANAAVDPNDRNHFLFSKAGQWKAWHSEDGGKTVAEYTDHNTGVYFVNIDKQGWMYTATQAGAFVTKDKGATWNALHVYISMKPGTGTCKTGDMKGSCEMDRVPHDYQNIIPDFRGDGIAFPSDQGLHILDRASENYTLISVIGDMKNPIALSALISPSKDGKTRNIVTNMWDWNVAASWDDGASWAAWKTNVEKAPYGCGEGGWGFAMGESQYQMMFHHGNWFQTSDGGHNWMQGTIAHGSPGQGFAYVRTAGSRTMPSGVYHAGLSAPDNSVPPSRAWARVSETDADAAGYTPINNEVNIGQETAPPPPPGPNVEWLMTSSDFGLNFTWTKMPANLQKTFTLSVDPTSATSLYAVTPDCLAHSTNNGKAWTPCMKATGLTGNFHSLIIKDSNTMFMLRGGAVPLKTIDGGATWAELASPVLAKLFKYGATLDGSLSWTGKTLVLHGRDLSSVGRGERSTKVFKSSDDGVTWGDETGDIITNSPGHAAWYEKDFYLTSGGEGIMVKRNFE